MSQRSRRKSRNQGRQSGARGRSGVAAASASAGDPVAAYNRLQICRPLPLLAIEDDCQSLANALIAAKSVPATEQEDALHSAVATVSKADFIATRNFSHLVGPVIKFRLQTQIQAMGFSLPILATPEE